MTSSSTPVSSPILGISSDYHDAAAALVIDGRIVAAAEEERFTRIKHDPSMPVNAIRWCLESSGIGPDGLSAVAFYAKPLTTYERILSTHAKVGPRGFPALAQAVSSWSKSKLWVAARIERALADLGVTMPALSFVEHHQSHAASAFYPSPFESAAVLTFDGVGEWATTSIGHGAGKRLEIVEELAFPDSIGLLYSAFTAFCGFEVNDGEYKLMGLAPYGEPVYADAIRDNVLHLAADGSFRIDQRWCDYRAGRRMTTPKLHRLLGGPPRTGDAPIGQREADIARSVQVVTEELVLAIAAHAHEITGERRACLAGGVALNCVANSRLLDEGPFDEIWVQPAAGDAGGSIGAALWEHHQRRGEPRVLDRGPAARDGMSGAFLGPAFGHDEIAAWLSDEGVSFEALADLGAVADHVADLIDGGATVGWFQGQMEFGPRALGHRSILADPRDPTMASKLNLAVKGREGFRPFAPAVLAEEADGWFDLPGPSPYMVFTAPVTASRRVEGPLAPGPAATGLAERLATVRSVIPACTHVDLSARVQTVDDTNPELQLLLRAFHRRTGCPVLLNTSFNRDGEPIVRTPADALRCFIATNLDVLVLERCVVRRDEATS
jgi:carbamoyltransferase